MRPQFELPEAPPVQVRGDSVTYVGSAARDALQLMNLGLSVLEGQAQQTGVGVPQRFLLVRFAAETAVADMRTLADVRESPDPAPSGTGRWVGVREAARLLNVGERQARRRVHQAGGTTTRKGLRVQESALLADEELRRSA